jgi:hypothetical protein
MFSFKRLGNSVLKGIHSTGKIVRRIGDLTSSVSKTLHGSAPLVHGLASSLAGHFGASAGGFNRAYDKGVGMAQLIGNRASVAGGLLAP